MQLRPGLCSPSNRKRLDKILELNALPKKGRLSAEERAREAEPAFADARRRHPGVESAINNLEHRGLDRIRLHGPDGFERAVGLAVIALNIHRIGMIERDRERRRILRERRRARERRTRAA